MQPGSRHLLYIVQEHYKLYGWAACFVFISLAYTDSLFLLNRKNELPFQGQHQRVHIAPHLSDQLLEVSLMYTDQKKPIAARILYTRHICKSREVFSREIDYVLSLADAQEFEMLSSLRLKNDLNGLVCYIKYIKGLYDDGYQDLASKRLAELPASLKKQTAIKQLIQDW